MKFSQLAIGQDFLFQGQRYTKASPLVASQAGTGASRLFPRYAVIEPAPATPDLPRSPEDPAVRRDELGPALERFQAECLAALDSLAGQVDRETLAGVRERITRASADFLNQIPAGDRVPFPRP
ncbi:MAG TPA: hypothetical protein EYP40_01650 [Chromatiales bacterium]|nr:hypothetical protein [Chromatiales bacterium]